jgi:hypothetical protein
MRRRWTVWLGCFGERNPEAHVYFAHDSEHAGGLWLPSLANEIAEATVFVLLAGCCCPIRSMTCGARWLSTVTAY